VWARLDDAILDNAKIIAAGPVGFALHVAAITWCARNLTDGRIPKRKVGTLLDFASVPAISAAEVAGDLEAIGLWHDRGEQWEVHDYLVYNPSRAQVVAAREGTRHRVDNHRKRKDFACNALHFASNGVTNGHVTVAPGPGPVPGEKKELARSDSRAPRAQRATPWPDDFTMTEALAAIAVALGLDPVWEWNSFKDHHGAKGSRFVRWPDAWRTWCRRSWEYAHRRGA